MTKLADKSKIPRLFSLLSERGVSAAELSRATGISPGNISDWKSGRSAPKGAQLALIADYFDVSADYLIGRSDIAERIPYNERERLLAAITSDPRLYELAERLASLPPERRAEIERFADFIARDEKE